MAESEVNEHEDSVVLVDFDDIHYDFDPKGDTIIVLKDADAEFAPWEDTQPSDALEPRKPDRDTIRTYGDAALKMYNQEIDAWQQFKIRATRGEVNRSETTSGEEQNKPHIHMRVSSKALTLTSSYFQKLFEGSWVETTGTEGGSRPYVVEAHSWSKEAFVILLNILHSRTRRVPRVLSLETFAKVAVLVDYYGCHEAVELFAETWGRDLPNRIRTFYNRDLILCLQIAWVFARKEELSDIGTILLLHSRGPVDTLGLPIPEHLIGWIEEKRQSCVSSALNKVLEAMKLMAANVNPASDCDDYACSSELLGRVTRKMLSHNMLSPTPTMPFLGVSWLSLKHCLSSIDEKKPKRERDRYGSYVETTHECCLVGKYLNSIKTEIETEYMKYTST